jgi:hypothetical protein
MSFTNLNLNNLSQVNKNSHFYYQIKRNCFYIFKGGIQIIVAFSNLVKSINFLSYLERHCKYIVHLSLKFHTLHLKLRSL